MINGCNTDNVIFNFSEFMEKLLNNQQNIRFSGADESHINGLADNTFNMLVIMSRTMFMHTALRCPKDTLSTGFFQC